MLVHGVVHHPKEIALVVPDEELQFKKVLFVHDHPSVVST
jgi:hypothetical protein